LKAAARTSPLPKVAIKLSTGTINQLFWLTQGLANRKERKQRAGVLDVFI
jgi:hypothetical protein